MIDRVQPERDEYVNSTTDIRAGGRDEYRMKHDSITLISPDSIAIDAIDREIEIVGVKIGGGVADLRVSGAAKRKRTASSKGSDFHKHEV